ncbi:MAG: hypothetical protein OH318_00295 [Candidatus Parvarchaeota archaeon]|nr:hypothetical protein [Candidatus Rehaiarchaeum fermentans]MCW1293403.1 hypothetical protein [Candidatus Rehaiarchaeum fermentans]
MKSSARNRKATRNKSNFSSTPLALIIAGFFISMIISIEFIILASIYENNISKVNYYGISGYTLNELVILNYISIVTDFIGILLAIILSKKPSKLIPLLIMLLGIMTFPSAGGFLAGIILVMLGGYLELRQLWSYQV